MQSFLFCSILCKRLQRTDCNYKALSQDRFSTTHSCNLHTDTVDFKNILFCTLLLSVPFNSNPQAYIPPLSPHLLHVFLPLPRICPTELFSPSFSCCPFLWSFPDGQMTECLSQLPRAQPVDIEAERHKLGSQGRRGARCRENIAILSPLYTVPGSGSALPSYAPRLSLNRHSFICQNICSGTRPKKRRQIYLHTRPSAWTAHKDRKSYAQTHMRKADEDMRGEAAPHTDSLRLPHAHR